MRSTALLFLFVTLSIQAQEKVARVDHEADAQRLVDDQVDHEKVVGIGAGFSTKDSTWMYGAGFADRNAKDPFTPRTRTRLASIAKPMTAIAIMQLAERGKIDLDAPLQDVLTTFPSKEQGTITVRQLLRHTAGIRSYKNSSERENMTHYPALSDAMKIFEESDLIAPPGEAFHYTTYGYVILGRVIEVASGMSYATYMKENVWSKAGMSNTGAEGLGTDHQAEIYHINGKGKISQPERTDLSDRVPGGGIQSTVADLLKFGDVVLNGTLVSAASLKEMLVDPGLKEGGNGYGLGWYLYGKNHDHGPVFGHNGSQTGASTFLMLLPDIGATVVVLSNTSGAMQDVSNTIVALFEHAAEADRTR